MDLGQGIPGLASKREYAGHAVGDLFFILQRFNMFFKRTTWSIRMKYIRSIDIVYLLRLEHSFSKHHQPDLAKHLWRLGRRFGLSVHLLDDITATFA